MSSEVIKFEENYFLTNWYFTDPKSEISANSFFEIKKINLNSLEILSESYVKKAQHIRSWAIAKHSQGNLLVFVDHGIDNPQKNHGGYPYFMLINKDQVKDFGNIKNIEKDFYFNVVKLNLKNQISNDLLFLTYHSKKSKIRLLKNNSTELVDLTSQIPSRWRDNEICLMSGMNFDFDDDGEDEVILGSCGENLGKNLLPRDLILKRDGTSFKFLPEEVMPLRSGGESWATAYFLKTDIDNDRVDEIVQLNHDKEITRSKIQVLKFNKAIKKFNDFKIDNNFDSDFNNLMPYYFHRVVSFDFDHDEEKDLLVQVNYLNPKKQKNPNIIWYKKEGDQFIYKGFIADKIKSKPIVGLSVLDSKLLIHYFDGHLQILD